VAEWAFDRGKVTGGTWPGGSKWPEGANDRTLFVTRSSGAFSGQKGKRRGRKGLLSPFSNTRLCDKRLENCSLKCSLVSHKMTTRATVYVLHSFITDRFWPHQAGNAYNTRDTTMAAKLFSSNPACFNFCSHANWKHVGVIAIASDRWWWDEHTEQRTFWNLFSV